MENISTLIFLVGLWLIQVIWANPIADCPQTENSYFISDVKNRCVYYQCLKGKWLLPSPFHCAPGTGTKVGFRGYDNPCTEHLQQCTGTNAGHSQNGNTNGGYQGKTGYQHPQNQQQQQNHPKSQGQGHMTGSYQNNQANQQQQPGSEVSQGQNGGSGTYYQINLAGLNLVPDNQENNQQQHNGQGANVQTYNGNGNQQHPSGSAQGGSYHSNVHVPVHGQGGNNMGSGGTQKTHGGDHKGHMYPSQVGGGGKKPALPRIVYKLDGYHLPMGDLVKGIYDIHSCLHGCVNNYTCSGFDFNYKDQQCWFHNQYSVCLDAVQKDFCAHYKLVHCASTTTTSTPSPETPVGPVTQPPAAFASFPDMCLGGGVQQPFITTLQDCQNSCGFDPLCQGVDFDGYNSTCFFHGSTTVCGVLLPQSYCTHFRYVNCPSGTLMLFQGTHALGGQLQLKITDPSECISRCQQEQYCIAIDFDSVTNSCWFHDQLTCSILNSKIDCVHIRLQQCI